MKLALGTAQFGLNYGIANTSGRVASKDALVILKLAHASGMDTLDTAITYGDSETILGDIGVQLWKTVSKLPEVPEGCTDVSRWVRQQIQGSLTRLGLDQLYAVLLHRPAQLLEKMGPPLFDALQKLRSDGLVLKIGASVYDPIELDILCEKYQFDLIQAPLNILDRRMIESGWAERLKSAGIEVHARSVFLQGLLLMPEQQRPPKFGRWQTIWQEWEQWLAENKLTPLQACLQFAVTQENIDRVVVGVDTAQQLKEIMLAADGKLLSLPSFDPLCDDRLMNPATWNQL